MTTAIIGPISVSGNPTPTLQWQESTDGGSTFPNMSGETNNSVVLDVPDVSWNGREYRCVATNSEGTATTIHALLTVTASGTGITIGVVTFTDQDYDVAVSYDLSDDITAGTPTNYYLLNTWPTGLSVNQQTGEVTGTTTETGVHSGLQFRATTDSGPLVYKKSGVTVTDISWTAATQRTDGTNYSTGDHYGYTLVVDDVEQVSFPTQYDVISWPLSSLEFAGPGTYACELRTIDTGLRKSVVSGAVTYDVTQPAPQEEATSAAFTLTVDAVAPEFSTGNIDFESNTYNIILISTLLTNTGGNDSITYSLAGASNPLPTGITVVNNNLEGTPTTAETGDVTLIALGDDSGTSDEQLFTWSVSEGLFLPLNLHPSWNTISGTFEENQSNEGIIKFLGNASGNETAIAFGVDSYTDVTFSCTCLLKSELQSTASFFLCIRMTDANNFIGVRSYNGNIEAYQRKNGSFGLLGRQSFPVAATFTVSLASASDQITLTVDGTPTVYTTTLLSTGRVGLVHREWSMGDPSSIEISSDYVIT